MRKVDFLGIMGQSWYVWGLILQVVQSSDSFQSLLAFVLRVLLHSLALNQSSTVLQNMFATQRSLVSKVIMMKPAYFADYFCCLLISFIRMKVYNLNMHGIR